MLATINLVSAPGQLDKFAARISHPIVDPKLTIKHGYIIYWNHSMVNNATPITICIDISNPAQRVGEFMVQSVDPYHQKKIIPALKHFIKLHDTLFPYSILIFVNTGNSSIIDYNINYIYPKGTIDHAWHTSAFLDGSFPWPSKHHYQKVYPPHRSRRHAFFLNTFHYPF